MCGPKRKNTFDGECAHLPHPVHIIKFNPSILTLKTSTFLDFMDYLMISYDFDLQRARNGERTPCLNRSVRVPETPQLQAY